MNNNYSEINNLYNIARKEIKYNNSGGREINLILDKFEILSETTFSKLFPEFTENITVRSIFNTALNIQLQTKTKSIDWEAFKKQVLNRYKDSSKKIFKIGFIVPIKIDKDIKFPINRLTINNVRFSLISENTFWKRYKSDEFEKHFNERYNKMKFFTALKDFKFFESTVEAVSDRDAIDSNERALDILRAIISWCDISGAYYWRFGEGKSQIAFPSPEIYIVKYNKKYTPYKVYYPEYYLYPPKLIKTDLSKSTKFKLVLKIVKKQKRNQLEDLLLKIIQTYSNALSSKKRSDTFLNYWRILEFATNSKERKNEEIVKLIYPYFNDQKYMYVGDLIVNARNSFVHSGDFTEYTDNYVNWVKQFADASIQIIFWLLKHGYENIADINDFFQFFRATKEINKKRLKILLDLKNRN